MNLFADIVLRKTIVLCLVCALVSLPLFAWLPKKYEILIMLGRDVFLLIPISFWVIGGLGSGLMKRYLVFAILITAGAAWYEMTGNSASLLLMFASLGAVVFIHRNSPGIIRDMGYAEPLAWGREIFFALLVSAVFVVPSLLAAKILVKSNFVIHSLGRYVLIFVTYTVHYGMLYGILYGVLFRRLMKMKYPLFVPIVLNIFLVFITWLADVLLFESVLNAVLASFFICLTMQFALGMAFYYCRSTRVVLMAHVIYFLVYKSIMFSMK